MWLQEHQGSSETSTFIPARKGTGMKQQLFKLCLAFLPVSTNFFRSQIFCYWKGHPSSEITSLRSFALLYKHADAGTPSTRISILSAQGSNMGNIQHLARMFPQNSGKADSYLDFSTHHLHSTYPPYAPKGQQNPREPSEQCTVCEPSFDKPWDKCATTQST